MQSSQPNTIQAAHHQTWLNAAIEAYCADCHDRVEPFVDKHLRGRAAWQVNRYALGWDLLRVPLNIAWAPFWLIAQLFALLCQWLRLLPVAVFLKRLPAGITTRVQRVMAELVEQELLLIDANLPDPLLPYLIKEADLPETEREALLQHLTLETGKQQFSAQMFGARTAVAEMTASISMAVVGAVMFKKFTPGALGGGAALAAWWTWQQAVSNFWLGDYLGGVWYGWFPPSVDWGARLLATALLMLILAVAASLSGFVTDPLQAKLGLHQRRLHRLIDKLAATLQKQLQAGAGTREQYMARVTDVLDMLMLAGRSAG